MELTSGSRTNTELTVNEIEASSGTIINTIAVGSNPHWRVFEWNRRLGHERRRKIQSVRSKHRAAKVIRTIPVGVKPQGISSDGTHVWVANAGGDTVSEIEASSGTVINTITVGSYPRGMSSDGTHAWVANFDENTVSEIEASSGTVVHTIPVGSEPMVVSSDGTHAWVGELRRKHGQ